MKLKTNVNYFDHNIYLTSILKEKLEVSHQWNTRRMYQGTHINTRNRRFISMA